MKDQKCRLSPTTLTIFILGLICILSISPANTAVAVADSGGSLSTYIIQIEKPTDKHFATSENLDDLYRSFLPTPATSSNQEQRMVHSYRHVLSGFAAKLTTEEAKSIRERDGVLSVRPEKDSNFGKGVIIGVLDSGIFPQHPSLSDEGVPPPPAKWKGKCVFNDTSCNNKLIGARSFIFEGVYLPTDDVGHGTHTASTAAGAFVKDASALGNAKGTATGMAPLAHLAIYQLLSGESGPYNTTSSNEAPWILTVGASTIDRSIKAMARLGNGKEFDGETLYQPHDFRPVPLPLVYPGLNGDNSSALCLPDSLKDRSDLQGKVVVCYVGGDVTRVEKGQEVKDAGGAAMILVNSPMEGATTLADKHVLPAVHVRYDVGREIKSYLNTTSAPNATILFKGTHIGRSAAPAVASFSSRGPNYQSPGILKPDIIGPGVNILAGWPSTVDNSTDKNHLFNVISGTSMSCPHLSGVAALLKSAHPDWSPAAIKSAIMTTATTSNMEGQPILDQSLNPANIFTTGAGHVNPSKAVDPGLIYDSKPQDYIPYLCGLNYTDSEIKLTVKEVVTCSSIGSIPDYQLNYPAISLKFNNSVSKVSVTRTVRNVGPAKSSYKVVIDPITGLDSIGVNPSKLEFTKANETASFRVDFTRNATATPPLAQGAITWVSVKHSVRTPIAVVFE
ncbi:hypothetical protein BT93_D0971 [Corymbia citriodora subsp. variegata]|nr:hypothetical protein BT93_D0971 [Corymbia citriodora subsp. variegata]